MTEIKAIVKRFIRTYKDKKYEYGYIAVSSNKLNKYIGREVILKIDDEVLS